MKWVDDKFLGNRPKIPSHLLPFLSLFFLLPIIFSSCSQLKGNDEKGKVTIIVVTNTQSLEPTPTPLPSETTFLTSTETPKPESTSTGTVAPTETPVPSPTTTQSPTDTPSPTSTSTPTPTVETAFDFNELAYYGGLPTATATPVFDPAKCEVAQRDLQGELPVIVLDGVSGEIKDGPANICIFGYPQSASITINLYGPKGRLVDQFDLVVEENINNISLINIPIKYSLDLAKGNWLVEIPAMAINGTTYQLETLEIPFNPGQEPLMSIQRQFNEPVRSPADPRRNAPLMAGERIYLRGSKFESGTRLPVGIFKIDFYSGLTLIDGDTVDVDEKGQFEVKFDLPPGLSGELLAVAVIDPDNPDVYYQMIKKFSVIGRND